MHLALLFKMALLMACIGLAVRIRRWFRPVALRSTRNRGSKTAVRSLPEKRRVAAFWGRFADVVLLRRTARKSLYRWWMHGFMLAGCLYLVLFHALGEVVTVRLFPDYAPTLNPWMMLRNLAGGMVLAGVAMAVIRRRAPRLRPLTRRGDVFALGSLLVIVVSGFLLESVKIMSAPVFEEMVEDYVCPERPEEVDPLRRYWETNFDVVFPDLPPGPAPRPVERGREIHEENCAACHSRPRAAFFAYPLSKLLRPAARILGGDEGGLVVVVHSRHGLFCGPGSSPFFQVFSHDRHAHPVADSTCFFARFAGGPAVAHAGPGCLYPMRRVQPALFGGARCSIPSADPCSPLGKNGIPPQGPASSPVVRVGHGGTGGGQRPLHVL